MCSAPVSSASRLAASAAASSWPDLAVFAILLAAGVGVASGVHDAVEPLARLRVEAVTLDWRELPAMRC